MKILMISDIHANWPALQTIQEAFDYAVCLGDLVDYGVEPGPCIDWVQTHCRFAVRGNHDHAVVQRVNSQGVNGFRWLTAVTRPITRSALNQGQHRFLAQLPITKTVKLGGRRFLFVHASPRDPLDEYAPNLESFWAERLTGVDADVICVGHTHQPYQLRVGRKLVINPGSVGLPRDGDPRASYAIIDDERVELKRIEYPIHDAVAAIEATTLPDAAKSMLRQVLRSGKLTPAMAIPEPSNGAMRGTG